jgi:small subunit ribosomal protein S15
MSSVLKPKKSSSKEKTKASNDTGSVEFQCSMLTKRINNLTEHFKIHKKDFTSKRGLLILVGQRRRLLDYLKSNSNDRYEALINKLGLRK